MLFISPALLAIACTASTLVSSAAVGSLGKRATPLAGFYDAASGGGSWLTHATSDDLGEPLNVVVSNLSDPFILAEAGFRDWLYSIQYSGEYAGISIGGPQSANLGDGQGFRNQTSLFRYNYFDVDFGTLHQSINGGPHLRYWKQNGTQGDSGAWFIAASTELSASEKHMIVPNGYDLGRDVLIGNATMLNGTISPITNRTFSAVVSFASGFLPPNGSSQGINHGIPTDGRVAILTVRVTSDASNSTAPAVAAPTAAPVRIASVFDCYRDDSDCLARLLRSRFADLSESRPSSALVEGNVFEASLGVTSDVGATDWTAQEDFSCDLASRLKARAFRVFQLVAEDTVEDRVLDVQKQKDKLISQAFSGNKTVIKKNEKIESRLNDIQTIFGL